MAKIKINAEAPLYNGMPVTFKAPCDCSIVDGLSVQYGEDKQQFVFTDAHGNELTGIGNLFGKDAIVKAVLDTDKGRAFVQNADTNAYLEERLSKTVSSINGQRGDVIITAQRIGAAGCEQREIDVTYERQTGGSIAEPIWTVLDTVKGTLYVSGNHFILKATICLTGGNVSYSINAGNLPRGSKIIGLYCRDVDFTMLEYTTDTRIYIYESGFSNYYTLYFWGVIEGEGSGSGGGGAEEPDWVQELINMATDAKDTAEEALDLSQQNAADIEEIKNSGGGGGGGADGFSPIANVTQTSNGATITITDKSGTTTATITNGVNGKDGTNGKDGYSPVRGVDYWTEEDKEEIIAEAQEDLQNTGKWEVIEKICFGYELLTEKPDDWDAAKTTKYYYANVDGNSKMTLCPSWFNWESNKYWKHTGEYDTQVQKIQRNQEPDGTPYNLKCVSVFGHIFNPSKAGLWCFSAYLNSNYVENNSIAGVATLAVSGETTPYHFNYRVTQENGTYNLLCFSGGQGDKTAVTGVSNAASGMMMKPSTSGNIKAISAHIWSAKEYYSEGDYIEIWGVRADG